MKKVIPFTSAGSTAATTASSTAADSHSAAPSKPGTSTSAPSTGAALAGNSPWVDGTEQLLVLLQRLIGCSNNTELLQRYFDWVSELGLAEGVTFIADGGAGTTTMGARRHHSANYDLTIENTRLGAITLCRRKRFAEEELMLIEQSLGSLARGLLVAQQINRLEAAATHDPLTGLLNRRTLAEWLQTELSRTRRHSSPLSVMMIDVDHFKTLNDRLGHLGGDKILRAIADVLKRSTRGSDLIFRFGGDEFTVLLPHTDDNGAAQAARQIRANLQRLSDEELGITEQAEGIRPDISVGVAAYHSGDDEESLMRRADTHLYHAKASGRGCVCSAL